MLRATRPDAITEGAAHLLKFVRHLRLTDQIRLQTLMAQAQGGRLLIHVAHNTELSEPLMRHLHAYQTVVGLVRADRKVG